MMENSLKPDRGSNFEAQDYRDLFAERTPPADDSADGSKIPELQPYMAQSSKRMKAMPLVSVSVNQSVSLRDALFELAKQADYDLELDPRIKGAIIFTARNRPFDQVIEKISDIAGLRYRFDEKSIRVELDTPYNKTYKIDYLSYVRSNKGSVRNDIAVVSGDGADTGSSFEATSESEADFWGELDENLKQILMSARTNIMVTGNDPRIMAVEQNPNVQAIAAQSSNGTVQVQPPNAVLRVDSLPVDDGQQSMSAGQEKGPSYLPDSTYAINKQGGLISVFAPEKAQKEIFEYLKLLRRATTAQVLIEAKILEVSLYDEFATGIDWRALDLLSGDLTLNYLNAAGGGFIDGLSAATSPTLAGATNATNSGVVVGYAGNDVQAAVQAISGFGSVKALASPRLTVLNNQSAVLNVATNRVYFEIDIDVTQDGGGATSTEVDSEIRNVPEGVLVNVQPSINLENRTISLAVRPTITRIVQSIPDPAVAFAVAGLPAGSSGAGIVSNIPELNVQEIDSVIQVRSGQPVIMGGLLQDRASLDEEGVPGLSEIPVFGALFRQHGDSIQKSELVIFLKATIVDSPRDTIENADRDMYRAFSADRRPFRM